MIPLRAPLVRNPLTARSIGYSNRRFHCLVNPHPGGIDHHGIVRRHQRGGRAADVSFIARADFGQNIFESEDSTAIVKLFHAPLRPHFR